jgi:Deacetylase PdaC/Protein of unknown function (DUF3298)
MRKFYRLAMTTIIASSFILPIHSKAEITQNSKFVQLAPTEKATIYEMKIKNTPIKYPQEKGLKNGQAQQKINSTLKNGAELANKNRLKLLADEKEAKKKWNSSQGPWRPYEYVFTYKVPFNHLDHLSVIYYEYYYTGGAHGMTTGTTYNFDMKTGDLIPLSKLIDSKTKIIQEFTYQQLQKKFSGYILIKSPNEIILNDKDRLWVFDKAGIKLIFNEYEVAAYAAGMPEIVVPYQVFQ